MSEISETILRVIKSDNKLLQKTIVPLYADMIVAIEGLTREEIYDVNHSIIYRWSKSGLTSIKKKAWKVVDEALKEYGNENGNEK